MPDLLGAGCWVLGAGCWCRVPVSGAWVPGAGVLPGAPAAAHRWISIDFALAQRMLADERPVRRIHFPWWHVSRPGHVGDLSRMPLRIVVGQQRKRRGTVWLVAHPAAIRQQRGDVALVGLCEHRRAAAQRHSQRCQPLDHRARSAMKQPTAGAFGRATGLPASTAISASARSCVVGDGRSTPSST